MTKKLDYGLTIKEFDGDVQADPYVSNHTTTTEFEDLWDVLTVHTPENCSIVDYLGISNWYESELASLGVGSNTPSGDDGEMSFLFAVNADFVTTVNRLYLTLGSNSKNRMYVTYVQTSGWQWNSNSGIYDITEWVNITGATVFHIKFKWKSSTNNFQMWLNGVEGTVGEYVDTETGSDIDYLQLYARNTGSNKTYYFNGIILPNRNARTYYENYFETGIVASTFVEYSPSVHGIATNELRDIDFSTLDKSQYPMQVKTLDGLSINKQIRWLQRCVKENNLFYLTMLDGLLEQLNNDEIRIKELEGKS